MEPPAKRRRHGKSPLDGADDDDDELSFQPHEILAQRDPGYKLSLDRAYADNRFQATMAHIFEKYGRDFDGIGDEIDMVTGEIVVNNGHVQNMRSEVDVGLPGVEDEDKDEDEDEGILLEDLTDGEGGDPASRSEQGDEEEDDEDRIMAGREPHEQSASLIPISRTNTARRPNELSALVPSLYGGRNWGYGPSAAAFGASPLSFGASPLAVGSWGLPNSFSDPWEPPDIFEKQPRLLPSPGDRYDFPAQDGGNSIWAANYRFKDNEPDQPRAPVSFGPRPTPGRTRMRPMKYLLPASAQKRRDEELDEDAILTGRSTKENKVAEVDQTPADDDDDDDLLISGTTPLKESAQIAVKPASPPIAENITRPHADKTEKNDREASKRRKQRTKPELHSASVEAEPQPPAASESEVLLDCRTAAAKSTVVPQTEKQAGASRRLSGRVRKQVDLGDKISWAELRSQRRSQPNMMVQLPSVDLSIRDEYEVVDDDNAAQEIADSEDEVPSAPVASGTAKSMASDQPAAVKTLQSTQDDSTPRSSGDARKTTSSSKLGSAGKAMQNPTNSIYLLSDDEMPVLSNSKSSNRNTRNRKRPTARLGSPGPPDSGIGDSVATLSSAEDAERNSTHSQSSRLQPGKPTKRLSSRKSKGTPDRGESDQSSIPVASAKERRRRLDRELAWLKRPKVDMAPAGETVSNEVNTRHLRSVGCSRENLGAANSASGKAKAAPEAPEQEETAPDDATEDEAPVAATGPSNPSSWQTSKTSPTKGPPSAKPTPQKQTPSVSKPQTPRHTAMPTRAPSSRRSILSLLSDDANDDEDGKDLDELGGSFAAAAAPFLSSGAASRKIWKSSARTTEVYHTPVKRRPTDVISPGSVIKTPGGTARTCGLGGYRCGRDFCFSCL